MSGFYSIYHKVDNFLEDPMGNWYSFNRSEASIWLDDRIYNKEIVDYFNESLEREDVVDKEIKKNELDNGFNMILKNHIKSLVIPFKDEKYDKIDRDNIVKSFDEFIKPKYEIRCFMDSLGSDKLIFTILKITEWENLEEKYDKEIVSYFFVPVSEFKEIFNMPTDEVTKISKERENKRDEIFKIIRQNMLRRHFE
ncbi:glutathione reductase [Fusobacterium simiae]|uniref:Glutathione reductase n=1 Tax=Fusobacterium simiae TaxID=855 RepID=A0ABT4DH91_FUSSI|nr:glutathione reductase [Fusobacterium simiae]MCY7007963.1 glutathione reductase [Fusobacterium simiae]